MSIFKIFRNALQRDFFPVMVKKIMKRMERDTSVEAVQWAERMATQGTDEYCSNIDRKLWDGIQLECAQIKKDADAILSEIPFSLGGGGNVPLLYFLIAKYKPNVVVETGVAAGWSSLTVLRAFSKNKKGNLYSSDFPYFRLDNPEQYIGIVTKHESNKNLWDLDTRGDDKALPSIISKLGDKQIDLFHYDSDKSYSGRQSAFETVRNKLSRNAIVIFDDIQDNLHFKDLVTSENVDFSVLEFEGKYLGVFHLTS